MYLYIHTYMGLSIHKIDQVLIHFGISSLHKYLFIKLYLLTERSDQRIFWKYSGHVTPGPFVVNSLRPVRVCNRTGDFTSVRRGLDVSLPICYDVP